MWGLSISLQNWLETSSGSKERPSETPTHHSRISVENLSVKKSDWEAPSPPFCGVEAGGRVGAKKSRAIAGEKSGC